MKDGKLAVADKRTAEIPTVNANASAAVLAAGRLSKLTQTLASVWRRRKRRWSKPVLVAAKDAVKAVVITRNTAINKKSVLRDALIFGEFFRRKPKPFFECSGKIVRTGIA